MSFDVEKVCRICLEEGVLTSLFTSDFGIMPFQMLMFCTKIKVQIDDGMPSHICNSCICRLGVSYHFKRQSENSDIRLRQYLGLDYKFPDVKDVATNTEEVYSKIIVLPERKDITVKKKKKKVNSKKKPEDQKLKRGPKPKPKQLQTCFECGKTFRCAAQLEMHIRTHTGERPFACPECPRRFAQKHNLSVHRRTHSGEKPFQCEICSKRFAALGNFQCHKKIHSGLRDQICPVCNKGFITSGDLSRHMITHTRIKNHHCDICGKGFFRRKTMVMHKYKDHLNIPKIQPNQVVLAAQQHQLPADHLDDSGVQRNNYVIATPAARRPIHPFHTPQDTLQSHPSLIGTHLPLNYLNYPYLVNDKKGINN